MGGKQLEIMPIISGLRKLHNNGKIAIRLSAKCLKKNCFEICQNTIQFFYLLLNICHGLMKKNEEYHNYSKCQTGGCGYRITTFYFFFSLIFISS